MCQGLTQSYGGLLAIRFLMGIFEASLPAGAAYMLSRYYTKREAAPRFACFFNFAMLGPMFSGLLAYAIENLNGRGGLEGWRWIFIIEGVATCFFSVSILVLLPNFAESGSTWLLKERERLYLVRKLEMSRGNEQEGSASDNVSLWKILLDWRIHLFTMCFFCCDVTASSLAGFAPTILAQLGWTASRAQLMTIPIWGSALVVSQAANTIASRLDLRYPFILGGICFELAGWIVMRVYVPEAGIRYFALFLLSMGTFLQMPMLMAWLSANLRGRRVRIYLVMANRRTMNANAAPSQHLAVGMAWMIGFGNSANLVSSNVFLSSEAPRYPTGFTTGLVFTIVGFCLVSTVTLLLVLKNKRRATKLVGLNAEEKAIEAETHFKFHL